MPGGVRIAVHNDESILAAVKDQISVVVVLLWRSTKYTFAGMFIACNIFDAPWCPECIHADPSKKELNYCTLFQLKCSIENGRLRYKLDLKTPV
jgi:hypothetical protein